MDGFPLTQEYLMHRFYTDSGRDKNGTVFLSAEDARHAVTVLRLKAGDRIEVIRESERYEAEILSTGCRDVSARILSALPSTEPSLQITLFQGLPKSDKMDLIVQKATELGVSRIVPVIMSRCVAKPDSSDIVRRLERWRRIARESGKQSGRCVIPEITGACTISVLRSLPALPEYNVVPWEEACSFGPLSFHAAHPSAASLGILIGPEGGIDKDEIGKLEADGFIPITLGKRILRTETAGLAAVASFMSLYGEMD